MKNQVEVILHVARALDELRIPYIVVGSVASSLQGFSRTTADVDILADFRVEHVAPLCAALKDEYYLDDQAMRRAVSLHRMFNLIHFDTAFKVVIYVARADEFTRRQLERRMRETLLPGEAGGVYVATPEDTILGKLQWHQRGGGVSERQLSDVLGVLKVQGTRLDLEYLREWAGRLGVVALQEKLLAEAGLV